MPPGTRNALVPPSQNAFGAPPTLAEIQLAQRTYPRPAPLTLAERAQEINYGLGRGFTNILQGNLDLAQALYQDPRAVGKQMLEGARGLVADPVGVVGNSLRGMWNRAKSSPAGLGEVVGENIDPRNFLKPRKAMRQELDVYHGTPHTFDPETGAPLGRFRSEKIGTGEGAQAYGYGLYLSEHPEVASSYKIGLTNPALHFTQELEDVLPSSLKGKAADWADEIQSGKTFGDLLATVRYPWQKTLLQQQKAPVENLIKRQQTGGSLYKVDLPDVKIEQMLDWDKPLSQQPKSVREALASLGDTQETINRYDESLLGALQGNAPDPGVLPKNPSGGDIVEQLQRKYGKAGASEYLRSLGIPGIKYLDAGSRKGEKGTRNFVVFPGEEQHLNILSRD